MLAVKDISYGYGREAEMRFPDITLSKTEQALILGQSGCGKTTLLHLIAGMLQPKTGNVLIDDTDINQIPTSQADRFRGQHVGIIFQQSYFIQAITVQDNLFLAASLSGMKIDKAYIHELLDKLGISHKAQSKPQELSQGEQQRATIARALVNKPKLILADEPTSALDDKNCLVVVDLLKSQATEQNATLVVVTHDNRLKDVFSKRIEL